VALTKVVWDYPAVRGLAEERSVVATVEDVALSLAREMAHAAARDTGAGADSIEARPGSRGSARVGWDEAHYYLLFPEYGTVDQAEQRFARDTLERHAL